MKTLIATLMIGVFGLSGLIVSDSAEASSYNYYGNSGQYLGKTQSNPFGGYSHYGNSGQYLGKTQSNPW